MTEIDFPDSDFSIITQEVEVSCDKHGDSKAEVWRTARNPTFTRARCAQCEVEREAEESRRADQEKAEQARKDARRLRDYHLQNSLIPPRFSGKDFDGYLPTGDKAKATLVVCRAYAEEFRKDSPSLILCGHAGSGKTHLACAIARHIIVNHGSSALFMKTAQAVRRVKETYSRDSKVSEQEAINGFRSPDLLILDEVGVQFGSDAEKNILFEIVNERYEAMKPTILISNLAITALTDYVGERVVDRMKENGGRLLIFDWQSHRGGTSRGEAA